jgi:hypothetical protein
MSLAHIPPCVLDDLRQEAWIRTFTASDVRHPRAYERRVLRHLAADWLRRQREAPDDPDRHATCPWSAVDARLDLEAALARAPARYRQLAIRHYLRGEPLDALIEEAAGGPRHAVGEQVWQRSRDATYKRRLRSLAWLADNMLAREAHAADSRTVRPRTAAR